MRCPNIHDLANEMQRRSPTLAPLGQHSTWRARHTRKARGPGQHAASAHGGPLSHHPCPTRVVRHPRFAISETRLLLLRQRWRMATQSSPSPIWHTQSLVEDAPGGIAHGWLKRAAVVPHVMRCWRCERRQVGRCGRDGTSILDAYGSPEEGLVVGGTRCRGNFFRTYFPSSP